MIGVLRDRFDAMAYRLFGRHVEADRHKRDRTRYMALSRSLPFETFLIRLYLASWLLALPVGGLIAFGIAVISQPPLAIALPGPRMLFEIRSQIWIQTLALFAGLLVSLLSSVFVRQLASVGLGYLHKREQADIEQTLPGAVRFLHVAASGTVDPRRLFEAVASRKRIHGATARSFEAICRRHAITGNMETAIRVGARDTPSQKLLAPFLLSFIERSRDGEAALRNFLADESRLLAVEDERRHRRDGAYLRTVVGLFVLVLVGPLVVGLGVAGGLIIVPEFGGTRAPIPIPELSGFVTAIGSAGILLFGGAAALLAFLVRPTGHRWAAPAPAQSLRNAIRTSMTNPTNALLLLLPIGLAVLVWGHLSDLQLGFGLLGAYVVVAIPTGLIDVRRSRRRTRLDRALPGFVHALAERLERGLPFREAVTRIAQEEDFGELDDPVRKLAADLTLLQGPNGGRKRALERFVGRLGTPFAGRTIGLAVGAIEAGADAQSAVAHLQTETGRLEHAASARRSRLPVMILVGWTVAMLIVAIVIAVNLMVLETATPTGPVAGVAVEAFDGTTRERPLFYVLTQATMLTSGWFAGLTGRGVYEALLHSGVLVAITWVGFRLVGLV
jgi:archaellum biogenesis protein FlaJ (TadC family)